jgi:hypothetical protein
MGGASAYCHETGCPNTHKVWDEEDQEWKTPEPEPEDDDYDYDNYDDDSDDDDYDYDPADLGPTGHGDICYSDADPGL